MKAGQGSWNPIELMASISNGTCLNPDRYFFWDPWHPSTKVHCLAAANVLDQMDQAHLLQGLGDKIQLESMEKSCLKGWKKNICLTLCRENPIDFWRFSRLFFDWFFYNFGEITPLPSLVRKFIFSWGVSFGGLQSRFWWGGLWVKEWNNQKIFSKNI